MNGFAESGLDERRFHGEANPGGLRVFDAFPKTKPTYITRTSAGGQFTVLLLIICFAFTFSELRHWRQGHTDHGFGVEAGVGHALQLNADLVLPMPCVDLHVNVRDASGDLIMAGEVLRKDDTVWKAWLGDRGARTGAGAGPGGIRMVHDDEIDDEEMALDNEMAADDEGFGEEEEEEESAQDVLGQAYRGSRRFSATPRRRRAKNGGACRIYGSMSLNRVQGDFHITARGHDPYADGPGSPTGHLDHTRFNFTHLIRELSFGPYYPRLVNPLDDALATTSEHFFKFNYYLSLVPTIYSLNRPASPQHRFEDPLSPLYDPEEMAEASDSRVVVTNQYAVTQHAHVIGNRQIPGVFFRFDIEPLVLEISDERESVLALLIRIVNIVSGVLVAGGWTLQILDCLPELGRRNGGRGWGDEGVLGRLMAGEKNSMA